jgi:hypothetical protein
MGHPWRLDCAIQVVRWIRRDQPKALGLAHDALQVVLDPERDVDGATLRHRLQGLHEIMGIELDDCLGADDWEYVSLQPAEHSFGVARRPLGHHAGIPIERDTFEGTPVDHGLSLGLLLELDGINAVGELLFEFKPFAARVSQSHYRVTAEGSETFAAIGLHVPEPLAFAPVGLYEQVEAVAVEELVLALPGFGCTAGGVSEGSCGPGHKGTFQYRIGRYP